MTKMWSPILLLLSVWILPSSVKASGISYDPDLGLLAFSGEPAAGLFRQFEFSGLIATVRESRTREGGWVGCLEGRQGNQPAEYGCEGDQIGELVGADARSLFESLPRQGDATSEYGEAVTVYGREAFCTRETIRGLAVKFSCVMRFQDGALVPIEPAIWGVLN